MTKEELKVMVDETINSNGARNITGKALNLALNAIVDSMGTSSGGGNSGDNSGDDGLKRNDVNFFDYDGTLLYAYTYEEACALTELPPLPIHDGLEVREWNYTLEDIKAQGHLDPYDPNGAFDLAGDFDFNGKTYKAYVPVGMTIEETPGIALCDGEPSDDNLTYLWIFKNEDNDWVDDGVYSFTGRILTGKADVGACVYDDGEQVQVPGVYIFERGIDESAMSIIDTVAWVVSIPNTIEDIYDGFMDSVACFNELKFPISVGYISDDYGAIQHSSLESLWWNGIKGNYSFPVTIAGIVEIPNSFSRVTYVPYASRIIYPKSVFDLQEIRSSNFTMHDFTRTAFVPSLSSTYCYNAMIIVPDALYDEWINSTNWSNLAEYIYPRSNFPWL